MRVHRLRVEAFGPFPGTVDIDLDTLSAEGLFLIHGPTGSGKTSLLDAICFALYADVPGARTKKCLRSDHAEEGAAPRVTLELTADGRRLRIVRSPEFSRPKKRGTGLLSVPATVTLEERLGGAWVARGTRNDEVADVVKDVMGMGMAQFASVVLLPQGDFATFLRASADDRRAVLERLFDITDYRDVEDWLAEARRAAGADLVRARSALSGELARVEDVLADAGVGVAESLAPGIPADRGVAALDGNPPADDASMRRDISPETVSERLADLLVVLDSRVSTTMAAYDEAVGADRRATESLERARVLTDLRARGDRARRDLGELASLGAVHDARIEAVAAAERASGLEGHLAARARSSAELDEAHDRVDAARTSLSTLLHDVPTDDAVAEAVVALRSHDSTVAARRHLSDDATSRAVRIGELEDRTSALGGELDQVRTRLERAESVTTDLDAEVEALAAAAATVPALTLGVTSARHAIERLDASDAALARVAELAPERDIARGIALDRRQDVLDLRTRRLEQMAGELALALAAGAPCPVCGSAEHPEPASTADPVRPDDLAAAETLLEQAEQAHRSLHDQVEAHRHRARTLRTTLDDTDRVTVESAALEVTTALDAARECAARHEDVVARRLAHMARTDTLRRRAASIGTQQTSVAEQLATLAAEHAAAEARLEDLEAAHGSCPCAMADPEGHARVGRLLISLQSTVEHLGAARRRAEAAEADLDGALAEAGFETAEDARACALSRDALARERALVAAHRERVAAAGAVASDPDVTAAQDGVAPDLEALGDEARAAREALLVARTVQDDAERTCRALRRLVPQVATACAAVTVATTRDARVRDVADTACGTGPDNTLRMRLTSFVLAARLEKVALLANERLAVMGGGRYLLEHSDDLAARGARSGLGLRVLDQWTGRTRDTATLSGGESFMASLALALGLADAVREEAGGFDLGTLFIDEGFGTLDDDSLEQVVTVLDGLREGGRAVGVVSHVADLRARITHQAVVHKGAAGSTVEVRVGARADPAA